MAVERGRQVRFMAVPYFGAVPDTNRPDFFPGRTSVFGMGLNLERSGAGGGV